MAKRENLLMNQVESYPLEAIAVSENLVRLT